MRRAIYVTYRAARRIVVAVVGTTVVLIGVALIVLPGPAFVVIPIGLGILGLEFAWARHWLHRIRDSARSWLGQAGSEPAPDPAAPPSGDESPASQP
jgi:tellurite resistance protein TerC